MESGGGVPRFGNRSIENSGLRRIRDSWVPQKDWNNKRRKVQVVILPKEGKPIESQIKIPKRK